MRIAIVLTVKNEAVLLPRCMEFHQLVGVTDFFVYYDHGSDKPDLPETGVGALTARDSVGRDDFELEEINNPTICKLLDLSGKHHTARQMLNSHHAILQARAAGIDWIASIDADEAVFPFDSLGQGETLRDFFGQIETANAVRFLPVEVCPRAENCHDPIYELTEFLNIFETKNGEILPGIRVSRPIYDPIHEQEVMYTGYLGHRAGKVAVKPEFDVEPYTVHGFQFRNAPECRQLDVMGLLHYNHYSFDDFLKKYKNFRHRPDRYAYGEEVEYIPKMLWRDMVNDPSFSDKQLREYFDRYVAWSDEDIIRLKAMDPSPLVSIVSPRELLKEARER